MIDIESALSQGLGGIRGATSSYDPKPTDILVGQPGSRIRLSASTIGLMQGCERRFQKTKLLHNPRARDESAAMSFGKGYGAAAQLYMIMRTEGHSVDEATDSAIWELFKNYVPLLEDDRRYLERAIYTLQRAVPFHERMLMEWEIASFNGRYASELSFKLEINETYYFVGYLDLALKHRKSGRYAVTDYKTTSLTATDLSPVYKFSDQVLGYSIILDAIVGAELGEFDTNYWVAQLPSRGKASMYEPIFHDLSFPKNLKDRFEWFLKLYLDVTRFETLAELDTYPKRGSNCMSFNKVCPFFNECQFTNTDRPAIYTPDTIEYDFTYHIDEIFESHRRRLAA